MGRENGLTKAITIIALTCFLVLGAAATAILGRDSVPSVSAEIRSPLCPSCRYSIDPLLLIADISNVQGRLLPLCRRVRVKVLL